ncbi:hypothetical protein GGQ13_002781 [Salinibacter ruber]|nr:hypothetical protein [Salinibacter ruber]
MPGPTTGAHVGGGASSGAVADAVLPTRCRAEAPGNPSSQTHRPAEASRAGVQRPRGGDYAVWGAVTAPTRSTAAARP